MGKCVYLWGEIITKNNLIFRWKSRPAVVFNSRRRPPPVGFISAGQWQLVYSLQFIRRSNPHLFIWGNVSGLLCGWCMARRRRSPGRDGRIAQRRAPPAGLQCHWIEADKVAKRRAFIHGEVFPLGHGGRDLADRWWGRPAATVEVQSSGNQRREERQLEKCLVHAT